MGREIVAWITEIFGGEAGKLLGVTIISMIPVIELRGAIPVAFALGVSWPAAVICAVVGNMLPIPFILLFLESVFNFMKKHNILAGLVEGFERTAFAKNQEIARYKFWGLTLFVAIPLPGTGGWTGALITSVMKMGKRFSILHIFLGVLAAAVIVTALTYGLVGFIVK